MSGDCLPDWLIVGGESGPYARAMNPEWAETLLKDCKYYGVAFFMKQLGGVHDRRSDLQSIPVELRIREFPETVRAVATENHGPRIDQIYTSNSEHAKFRK